MTEPTPFRVLSRPLPAPDYWRQDPVLQSLLARLLPAAARDWIAPQLEQMGEVAATRVDELARLADRTPPAHRPYDPFGERIDEIVYHPSYRQMEEVAYGSGMVGVKYEPELRQRFPAAGQVLGFALSYLFAQAESGLYCPVCMTDGVARVLELRGTAEQQRRVIPHLASRRLETLWRGAMFLTEKQGGSDVGANATRAVAEGGGWRLHGEKWFCSNVDAEAILTLARPDGAPPGTRGLGLFLVQPRLPDGRRNGLRIDRLKDKLGVRSMATGEVTLQGAVAELVGPVDEGFKGMAVMLNLSRLYNAVASAAIVRRAAFEATRYLRGRDAFGHRALTLPLVRESLADLHAEEIAGKHLVFQLAEHLDRADAGGALDARRVRLLTPLAKYYLAKQSVWAASEAIELHGGNGYIEDFVTPRLLRDAQVLPVWEGTTNILLLDAMRACRKGAAHELLFADTLARCAAAPRELADEAQRVQEQVRALARQLSEQAGAPEDRQAAELRGWCDGLTRAYQLGLLLEGARVPAVAPVLAAAIRRLLVRHTASAAPLRREELDVLVEAPVGS